MITLPQRASARAAVGFLAGTLAITGAVAVAYPAGAVEGFAFERLDGQNRYETAAEIATDSFTTVQRVVLASGEERNFPDALTGNYLAGFANAPILLTETSRVPSPTSDALRALDPDRITIVGGTSAVSSSVESSLRSAGYAVDRIGGDDRYDTAAAVGVSIPDTYVGEVDGLRTAFLGNGQNFPDILASSPGSYEAALPITITRPTSLPAETENELRQLDIEQVIIVGGPTAVSTAVEARVDQIVDQVRRIDGRDRYETAREIADFTLADLDFVDTHVNLARGDRFPDALAGGPHAGRDRAPIVLTDPSTLVTPAEQYLEANDCALTAGHIFGGTAAISQSVENRAEQVAGSCEDPQPAPTADFSVTPDSTVTLSCLPNPDSSVQDDRSYNVAGLEQGVEYRVTLLEASTVRGGTSASDPVKFTDSDNDNLAETGTTTADITSVNGAAPQNNTGDGTTRTNNNLADSRTVVFTARTDGTATFTVDGGGAAESFRPVVYVNGGSSNADDDGGQSPRLELNNDDTAAEAFDLGGVTTCSGASATSTNTRPELLSASIVSSSTPPATGTSVRYNFDETVSVADITAFQLYYDDGTLADAAGDSAVAEGSSVTVTFGEVNTADEFTRLTVATVDLRAVLDAGGQANPEGAAAIGSASQGQTVSNAGITAAPDLLTVDNFRPSATAGITAVDFTFDEAAFVTGDRGFRLVLLTGGELTGLEQSTVAGQNGNGTAKITVLFTNPDGGDDDTSAGGQFDPTISSSSVARGTVDDGTVADQQQSGPVTSSTPPFTTSNPVENNANVNPLQAAHVSNGGNSNRPDLVSVELRPNSNPLAGDAALYTFDEPVFLDADGPDADAFGPAPENFRLYKNDARFISGDSAQVNSSNPRQVLVQFSEFDASDNVSGGNVLDDAVFQAENPFAAAPPPLGGTRGPNQQDEEPVTSVNSVGAREPGFTDDPDLTGVALTRPTTSDPFGNETQGDYRATYTFDEAFQSSPIANRFLLYLADGTRLVATTCATGTTTSGTGQNNNTATCTAYRVDTDADGVLETGEPNATSAQVGSAVLGAVDNGAVTAFDGGTNPEGAKPTTGGTGTRTQ